MKVKYAYVVFNHAFPFPKLDQPFRFDQSTELRFGTIKQQIENPNSEHWPKWIGSIRWETICENKLVLSSWVKTETPDILNGENKDVSSKVANIFRLLPLAGSFIPPWTETFLLTGHGTYTQNGVVAEDIRSFTEITTWQRPYFSDNEFFPEYSTWAETALQTQDSLARWKECYEHFDALLIRSTNYRQLLEGYRSFEEAMKSSQLEFKIPNLVRAIESLAVCWNNKEFARNTLSLTGPLNTNLPFSVSTGTRRLLRDLYQLRNDCSHGKPFGYSLQKKINPDQLRAFIAQYEFVAEWCARKIIIDSFRNQTMLNVCNDHEVLAKAWRDGTFDGRVRGNWFRKARKVLDRFHC